MIEEAIQKICDLAVEANEPKEFHPQAEPPHVYFIQDKEGDFVRHDAEPMVRNHKALSIEALVDFAKIHKDEGAPVVIWYSRNGVFAILNDASRRDRIALDLSYSEQFNYIKTPAPQLNQKQMLIAFRIQLADCLGMHPSLIDMLRKVDWKRVEESSGEVRQGKVSLGKKLEANLSNLPGLPEEVTLDMPIFHGYSWRAQIRCAFEADAETISFCLRPLAGQLEAGIRQGEFSLLTTLDETLRIAEATSIPTYYGTP